MPDKRVTIPEKGYLVLGIIITLAAVAIELLVVTSMIYMGLDLIIRDLGQTPMKATHLTGLGFVILRTGARVWVTPVGSTVHFMVKK